MDCQQNNTDPKSNATLDSKEDSSDDNVVISKDGKKDACKIDQTKVVAMLIPNCHYHGLLIN